MDLKTILDRKLRSLFPEAKLRHEVVSILDGYGIEDYEREAVRVRLAILKIAEPTLESVAKTTQMAKVDYRDVLSWAEYPRQIKAWSRMDKADRQKLIEADRKAYEDWLKL